MAFDGFYGFVKEYRHRVEAQLAEVDSHRQEGKGAAVSAVSGDSLATGDKVAGEKTQDSLGFQSRVAAVAAVSGKNEYTLHVKGGEPPPVAPPSYEALLDRLTAAYIKQSQGLPYIRPRDDLKAAAYWRARAARDLARQGDDPNAAWAIVLREEARVAPDADLVLIGFVPGGSPPAPGLRSISTAASPHAGLMRAARVRPPSWQQREATTRVAAGAFCGSCGKQSWRSSEDGLRWWCVVCNPSAVGK